MTHHEFVTQRAAIAWICGIPEKEVEQLARDGIIPKPLVRGQYDVPECCKAYFTHYKANTIPLVGNAHGLADFLKLTTAAISLESSHAIR